MPPIGRRPSSGDVDLGTGIYLIAGAHSSEETSLAGSTGVSAATVRGSGVATGAAEDLGATDEDDLATEEDDSLIAAEDRAELDTGFAELDAGLTALDTDFDADETATDG